jgi:diadenosine tetraphosphatase ApaH/serine/threonine PP2A family protein phosphatase
LISKQNSFWLVHGTLDMPERWGYVFEALEAEANFTYQFTPLCFFGHTHIPLAFEKTDFVKGGLYTTVKVRLGSKYFVNVGSVGQPRDGDNRAAYVVYDLTANSLELRRVEYDIAAAQEKITKAGLPPRMAARLAVGR